MDRADHDAAHLFLDFSRRKLIEEYWPRLRSSVESLTDEQVWWRPNDACNSVGNLLLHLNGNVRQWLVWSFTRIEGARDRPAEFSERRPGAPRAILDELATTMKEAAGVLASIDASDLTATFRIQGYTVTGLDAVYHVVEHFGMHYGQILYITKMLRDVNLGFYRELDKTGYRE